MDDAIEVSGLTKTYGETKALDDLSLSLAPGQVVGLLGENGCGKTTLLKVLAGVMADYSGDVRVAGLQPGWRSKAHVAFLPDVSFLRDDARVDDCLGLFRDFFDDFDRAKAAELVGFFGLPASQRLKAMSKGMREKLQVALLLSRRAPVVLMDEPISGVDPAARDVILKGVLRGISEDSLVLIATHLVHDLEPILDAIVMMRHGRVLLEGPVDDLRAEHGSSIDQLFRKAYSWAAR